MHFYKVAVTTLLVVSLGACDSPQSAPENSLADGEQTDNSGKNDASAPSVDKRCTEMWEAFNACVDAGGSICEGELATLCESPGAPDWCELVIVDGVFDASSCELDVDGAAKDGSYCVSRSEYQCRTSSACTVWHYLPDPTPTDGAENGTLYWDECYDAGGAFLYNANVTFSGNWTCCEGQRS